MRVRLAVVAVLIACPPFAAAGDAAAPAALNATLRRGRFVEVVTSNGQTIRGHLVTVTPGGLRLAVERLGAVDLPAPEIALVSQRDRVANGALLGATMGVATGLILIPFLDVLDQADDDGRSDPCVSTCRAVVIGTSTALSAGMGALVDSWQHGWQVAYRKPSASRGRVTIAPGVDRRTRQVQITVRF